MKLGELTAVFDSIARTHHAADWDNVGLLVGDPASEVRAAMLCIDLTAPVLAEARRHKAQLILAYHPPLFKPLTRLTPQSVPVLWAALQAKLAIYSMHTALDVAQGGTNDVLADVLGMTPDAPIEPAEASCTCKVVVFTPTGNVDAVAAAAFEAGAGRIGDYAECSFRSGGEGTFLGGEFTIPVVGLKGRRECVPEIRLEVACPITQRHAVVEAIRAVHSYEEPAIDVYPLLGQGHGGMGRVGGFGKPVTEQTLISRIKRGLGVKHVQIARPDGRTAQAKVTRGACAAGSCGEMWRQAVAAGATFYVTGEMKHHEALAAAAAGLTVVCVGHSNSERMVLGPLASRLADQAPGVRWLVAQADCDPFEIL